MTDLERARRWIDGFVGRCKMIDANPAVGIPEDEGLAAEFAAVRSESEAEIQALKAQVAALRWANDNPHDMMAPPHDGIHRNDCRKCNILSDTEAAAREHDERLKQDTFKRTLEAAAHTAVSAESVHLLEKWEPKDPAGTSQVALCHGATLAEARNRILALTLADIEPPRSTP